MTRYQTVRYPGSSRWQRLQLFHYLVQLAAADGEVSRSEKDVLESVASAIRLSSSDASSVIAMFYKDRDSDEIVSYVITAVWDESGALQNYPTDVRRNYIGTLLASPAAPDA